MRQPRSRCRAGPVLGDGRCARPVHPPDEGSAVAIAKGIGLDIGKFNEWVQRTLDRTRVGDDNLDARAAEFPTTPVFFAQGERVTAAPSAWHLTEILTKVITLIEHELRSHWKHSDV